MKMLMKGLQKLFRFLLHRLTIFIVAMVLQLAVLVAMFVYFSEYYFYFYIVCLLASLVAVLRLVNGKSNPAYKVAWLFPILLFPLFGGIFYLIFGANRLSRRQMEKMQGIADAQKQFVEGRESLLDTLEAENADAANQARYIEHFAYSPLFSSTQTAYLPIGEEKFGRMLEELEKAERYIFLEYFIIQEGEMWDPILEILARKAAQGLDVRVMYDDMGCVMTLPWNYAQKLREKGIQCAVFNPLVPVLSLRFNNRDHRKICVIDGKVGFTGGINLADEYINAYEKHGHWKDTAVLLKGDAVEGLTVMFLTVWDYTVGIKEDFSAFKPAPASLPEAEGYVQPFTDNPLDQEPVGETVYLNLINKAKKYVYITTPYLILSNEMIMALTAAAKGGVDVRIITPHVPDKWYVHMVTRANYEELVEAGVRIYEYTPGFIHAKTFVVDDLYGVVGTINLDYRSLYLHFECAAWMYKTACLGDIKADFFKTLTKCQEITLEACRSRPLGIRFLSSILKLFAPLM